ncbi:MAG: PAS domain S-box protein [Gemmatimonadetes bacterium]|nr:PAS domain S-box protein [Gemmatimonadota bacterium]
MSPTPEHDEAFFRRLVDSASDLIVVLDGEGRVAFANPSVGRVLGYAPESVLGRSAFELVHPDDLATVEEAIATEFAGKTSVWYIEIRMRAADGEWVPLEVKGRRDRTSPTPRIVVHARDLRERRRVEHALRDQYAWTRALVDASPLAIVTLDEAQTVTFWNPVAERLFGWTAQEVLGRPLPIWEPDAAVEGERIHQVLTEGQSFSMYEGRRRRRDGRFVDVSISLAPLRDAEGAIRGVIKTLSDIGQQKQLEHRFRQAEQLDATGRLAGGIAHDFNNLLGTIVTSASLIREELPTGSPLLADADAILEAARRANVLTRQLRTVGRRHASRPRRLALDAAVAAIEVEGRAKLPVGVRSTFSAGAPEVHVVADPEQLREAVLQLVANAADAMPNGGQLALETRVLRLVGADAAASEVHPGTYALVAISDTGVGMPPDVLERCFEPFFTTKQRRDNPGLGLAAAYAIARQFGGGLVASSEPGIGTTMRLYVPVAADEAPRRTSQELPAYSGRATETVLLVEDDATFRAVVKRALTQHGYTVLDAAAGAEALLVHEQHPGTIDLLVTDLVMPDISGRELALRLRPLRPGLRVLYMSGYSADVLRGAGGLNAHEAFIQKPFAPADFVGAVRGLLDVLA